MQTQVNCFDLNFKSCLVHCWRRVVRCCVIINIVLIAAQTVISVDHPQISRKIKICRRNGIFFVFCRIVCSWFLKFRTTLPSHYFVGKSVSIRAAMAVERNLLENIRISRWIYPKWDLTLLSTAWLQSVGRSLEWVLMCFGCRTRETCFCLRNNNCHL